MKQVYTGALPRLPRNRPELGDLQKWLHSLPLYSFTDYQEVAAYLKKHRFLIPILTEAYPVIQRYFGPDAPVRIEVSTDPEEGYQELVAWIQTHLPPEKAVDALDRFDWEWWLNVSLDAKGKLCFDVGYR